MVGGQFLRNLKYIGFVKNGSEIFSIKSMASSWSVVGKTRRGKKLVALSILVALNLTKL